MSELASAQEEARRYREYMDEQDRKRRPHRAPPSPEPLTFESWRHVPGGFKTRRQWLWLGRKLKPRETASARVVYPRFIEEDESLFDVEVLDSSDGLTRVTSKPTELFRESQTSPYTPTPRTEAYWTFEDIFFCGANTKDWIYRSISDGGEESDWVTLQANGNCGLRHDPRYLTAAKVRSHLNHHRIVGIKNRTGQTRFVAIDLDYHGRDREVFLEQARVLLEYFHGDTWHYQVKKEDVSGLHFFRVFSKKIDLETSHAEIRAKLQQLDEEHADLRDRAHSVGMKSLGELEIYPTQGQGMRLPLAYDRWMILDDFVGTTTVTNRKVADVERYVSWLKDPNRKHKPPGEILDYLRAFTFDGDARKPRAAATSFAKTQRRPSNKNWTNAQRHNFIAFWLHGESNGISLNEHIAVLARTAWAYGYTEEQAVAGIRQMVRQLPKTAISASQRLLSNKWSQIANAINSTVRYSYEDNSRQRDIVSSTRKLQLVAAHYKSIGFDPLNPASWRHAASSHKQLRFAWSESQRKRLVAFLRTPLNAPTDADILPFVEGVIRLANEMIGRQWGHRYFHVWAKAEYPHIKLGCTAKRLNVLRALTDEGILRRVRCGSKRTGCSEWELGPVATAAIQTTISASSATDILSEEDLGEGSLLQGVRARPSATIQSYSGVNAVRTDIHNTYTHSPKNHPFLTPIYIGFYSELTRATSPYSPTLFASGLDPPQPT